MHKNLRSFALLTLAGLILCLAGCDGKYSDRLPRSGATLEGTVTYRGQHVLVGLVIVQGEKDGAHGFIGDDGSFKIDNVPLGEVNIAVNTEAGRGNMMGKVMAQSYGKADGPVPKVISLPAKYFDPHTSGITTTIQKGTNRFDIVISK